MNLKNEMRLLSHETPLRVAFHGRSSHYGLASRVRDGWASNCILLHTTAFIHALHGVHVVHGGLQVTLRRGVPAVPRVARSLQAPPWADEVGFFLGTADPNSPSRGVPSCPAPVWSVTRAGRQKLVVWVVTNSVDLG
jgi:hypothetical protein